MQGAQHANSHLEKREQLDQALVACQQQKVQNQVCLAMDTAVYTVKGCVCVFSKTLISD